MLPSRLYGEQKDTPPWQRRLDLEEPLTIAGEALAETPRRALLHAEREGHDLGVRPVDVVVHRLPSGGSEAERVVLEFLVRTQRTRRGSARNASTSAMLRPHRGSRSNFSDCIWWMLVLASLRIPLKVAPGRELPER